MKLNPISFGRHFKHLSVKMTTGGFSGICRCSDFLLVGTAITRFQEVAAPGQKNSHTLIHSPLVVFTLVVCVLIKHRK